MRTLLPIFLSCATCFGGLLLSTGESKADFTFDCGHSNEVGPQQVAVGDIVFNIPWGQCFDGYKGHLGRGLESIRVWRPDMSNIAGIQDYISTETYALSILIVDVSGQQFPEKPLDSWCNWLEMQPEHIASTGEMAFNSVNGYRLFWNFDDAAIFPEGGTRLFGSPIVVWSSKTPAGLFNFRTDVALSERVTIHITFDNRDLEQIDIKTLLSNIDRNIRSWIVPQLSARLIHETAKACS